MSFSNARTRSNFEADASRKTASNSLITRSPVIFNSSQILDHCKTLKPSLIRAQDDNLPNIKPREPKLDREPRPSNLVAFASSGCRRGLSSAQRVRGPRENGQSPRE